MANDYARKVGNIFTDTLSVIGRIDNALVSALTKEKEEQTSRTLWCEKCRSTRPHRTAIMFGCVDQHLFDVHSVSYFEWGMFFRYFFISEPWFLLFLMAMVKMGRMSNIVERQIYTKSQTETYGTVRSAQSIISMYGDILSVLLGFYAATYFSWLINIPAIIIINYFAGSYGADFISSLSWYLDFVGLSKHRIRYLPTSSLEKLYSKAYIETTCESQKVVEASPNISIESPRPSTVVVVEQPQTIPDFVSLLRTVTTGYPSIPTIGKKTK